MNKKIRLCFFIIACFCFLLSCDKQNVTDEEPSVCSHPSFQKEFTVLQNPTLESVGTAECECARCGQKVWKDIPMLNESSYSVLGMPATCTADGVKTYHSDIWGEYSFTISAYGHDFVEQSDLSTVTCEEDGVTVYACSRCQEKKEVDTLATGHDLQIKSMQKGTCYVKGYVQYYCTKCDFLPPAIYDITFNHDFVYDSHYDGDCSLDKKGYSLYICSICQAENIIEDEELSHRFLSSTGKCEDCGKECLHSFSGFVCSKCDFDIEKEVAQNGIYYYDKDSDGMEVGEIVYFGTYPGSHVGGETAKALDKLYDEEETVYEYKGSTYLACSVLSQPYRSAMRFSDGVSLSTVGRGEFDHTDIHFFKYEPIEWIVVEVKEDSLVLECGSILFFSKYLESENYVLSNGENYYAERGQKTVFYAVDWAHSTLRSFLNGEFLTSAFTEDERDIIQEVTLDNENTGYYENKYQSAQESTTDYVYLPAFTDYYKKDGDVTTADAKKIKKVNDYLLCTEQVDFADNSASWWIRSCGNSSLCVCCIDSEGKLEYATSITTVMGVSPFVCVEYCPKE